MVAVDRPGMNHDLMRAGRLTAILPRAELRAAVQAGAGALRPLLAELAQAAAARRVAGDEFERPPAFVVAIDQADELFRAEGREDSESLLALLAGLAAGDDPTVIVIFTIRSDSYDALQSAKALEGLRQVAFSLLPMPRGAYNDVIEGPARRVEEAGGKLAIEPALTQRLFVDIEAGAGDALPLLAFTLEQFISTIARPARCNSSITKSSAGSKARSTRRLSGPLCARMPIRAFPAIVTERELNAFVRALAEHGLETVLALFSDNKSPKW